MPGKLSVFSANRVLNKILRGVDWVPAASYWVALFTGAAESALRANAIASAGEVVDTFGYARIEVRGATLITFADSTAGVTQNSSAIAWAVSTGSWGTVTHVALMDSATLGAGNVIMYGVLPTPKAVDSGDSVRINTGLLSILL